MNPLRESSVVLLAMVVATASAAAQSDQPATQSGVQQSDVVLDWRGIENNFYANAKPYVDLSLADLRGALPELRELEPAQNQDQLPSLLNKTGERTRDLMHNMPNLIAEEKLVTRIGAKGKPARQDYEYLILSHRESNNAVVFDEYRTGANGKSSKDVEEPLTKGFASAWIWFYPSHQSESRFRYLGQQSIDGHRTSVIAFAQVPDAVHFPTQVSFGGARIAVLEQGVAWVDHTDFRIVRMRTDLLAPRPDVYLQKMTAEVRFKELPLAEGGTPLWVPDEATVTWNFKGQTIQQLHSYSKYRLYAVKSKIVP